MAPKTMIRPPQVAESGTVTRPAPTGGDTSTDPRLPAPGSAIVRKCKGCTVRVVVLEDGNPAADAEVCGAGQKCRSSLSLLLISGLLAHRDWQARC
jgi:hypothetical protein